MLRAGWALRRSGRDEVFSLDRVDWKRINWKKAAAVGAAFVALLAASISLAGQLADFRTRDPLGHVHRLIDVRTGDVYEWDTLKIGAVALPARDPATGVIALLPICELESGRWGVTERDLHLLGSLDAGVEVRAVDPASGAVVTISKDVKAYTKFKRS